MRGQSLFLFYLPLRFLGRLRLKILPISFDRRTSVVASSLKNCRILSVSCIRDLLTETRPWVDPASTVRQGCPYKYHATNNILVFLRKFRAKLLIDIGKQGIQNPLTSCRHGVCFFGLIDNLHHTQSHVLIKNQLNLRLQ